MKVPFTQFKNCLNSYASYLEADQNLNNCQNLNSNIILVFLIYNLIGGDLGEEGTPEDILSGELLISIINSNAL